MDSYCVYIHTAPNGKVYIGQTKQSVNQRWLGGQGYVNSPHFFNAIKKYGWENFTHEIIASNLTSEEADYLEKKLIQQFNSCDPQFGYNLQLGGHRGQVHSEETKRKISNSMKQLYKNGFTEEHRRNISIGKKNKLLTKEAREAILSNALKNIDKMRGKPLTDEHKRKISEAKKGKPGRVWTEEQRRKHSEIMKKVYSA